MQGWVAPSLAPSPLEFTSAFRTESAPQSSE